MISRTQQYTIRDTRGVSVVIGLLLLLTILFLAAAQYQVTVVPQQEETTEIEHYQQVASEFDKIQTNLVGTSNTGAANSQQLTMGARYQQGTIFGIVPKIHPLNPAGTIQTVELGSDSTTSELGISNAVGVRPSTQSYWTRSVDHTYETRGLEYSVDYNEFRDNPDIVYENSVLYERYPNGADPTEYIIQSDQSIISGNSVNLVALTGNIRENRIRPTTVETLPVSAPGKTILLTNEESNPIEIEVPTRLPESEWEQLLAEERVSNGGNIQNLQYDSSTNILTIVLAPDTTYSVTLSRVHTTTQSQNERIPTESAEYVAWAGNDRQLIQDGEQTEITAQVRDRFNNPVSGQLTEAYVYQTDGSCIGDFIPSQYNPDPSDSCGRQQPGVIPSGQDGRVTYYYTADVSEDTDVTIDISLYSETTSFDTVPETNEETVLSVVENSTATTYSHTLLNSPTLKNNQETTTTLPELVGLPYQSEPNPFLRIGKTTYLTPDNSFRVLSVTPDQSKQTLGSKITVNVLVDNIGQTTLTESVTLSTDKSAIISPTDHTVELAPGNHARIQYTFIPTEVGEYTFQINGEDTAQIEVKDVGNLAYSATIDSEFQNEEILQRPTRFKDGTGEVLEVQETPDSPPTSDPNNPFDGVTGDIQQFGQLTDDEYITRVNSDGTLNAGILFPSVEPNRIYTVTTTYEDPIGSPLQLKVFKNGDTHIGSDAGIESTYYLTGENKTQQFQLTTEENNYIRSQQQLGLVLQSDGSITTDIQSLYLESSSKSLLNDTETPIITRFSIVEPTISQHESFTVEVDVENPSREYTTRVIELDAKSTYDTNFTQTDQFETTINPQTQLSQNSPTQQEVLDNSDPGEYTYQISPSDEYIVSSSCTCTDTITIEE